MNSLTLILLYGCFCICAIKGRSSVGKVKRENPFQERLKQDVTNRIHTRERRTEKKKAYLLFDNRSERTVQLLWRHIYDRSEKWLIFKQLKPGEIRPVDTFDSHEWKVVEMSDKKSLTINDASIFTPKANTRKTRTVCIIKRPDQSKDDIVIKKFIETLIVVDKSVTNIFETESEAERYVNVLFSLATRVFYNSGLTKHGLEINIVASKIIFHVDEIKLNALKRDNLDIACRRMNDIAKIEQKKYDHKLFLTKKGFGKAGIGKINAMCSQSQSCSLVFDQGFSSTNLIAHEIAHSLGLLHIDLRQFVSPFVMTKTLSSNNVRWAPESQIALLTKTRNRFSCLDNQPSITSLINENYERPGIYFSFEKQCDLDFSVAYTAAWRLMKSRDPCEQLTCRMPGIFSHLIQSRGSPALDGTNCGGNKWCISGKCQKKTA